MHSLHLATQAQQIRDTLPTLADDARGAGWRRARGEVL